ncbi:MAG: hypothetical protein H6712_27105 [Myxococcales bacterium]|nr:hypothetical protein [Myxococcales bacterium]
MGYPGPTTTAIYHFRRLRPSDEPLVTQWRERPEVRRWWGEELGARFRPAREVLEPTVAWLREQGLVPPARE